MRRAFLEKDGSKMEKARLMTDPRVGSGALFGERRLETSSEQKSEYTGVTTGNSSLLVAEAGVENTGRWTRRE